ncbi:MAG: DNA gyrase inhibitor YacG [Deltaproteobacteria bacterium]|nr:DNA gyrase inhibitor YacG [Deltaproteobacteria bacterium]
MQAKAIKTKVRCPSCKNWTSWQDNPLRPFCSEQCKKRDLGNWATERYRIATDETEEASLDNKGGKRD